MNEFIVTTSIKKMLRLKKRRRVIQGGSSSGKTFGIIPILIDIAIKQPHKEISIVSESVPHLRRGAMKDFLKIMIMTGRYEANKFNKSIMKYTFANGSYIEFFSVDDESKLRGARRNILYMNEANNISFESYQQLAIRTSDTIWIDYNPSASFWAHSELIPLDDTDFIITTYKDNEALPQSIVDELESAREKGKTSKYWANYWRVYGLGLIGSLEGACIPDWTEIESIPEGAKLLGAGLDFGYTNDATSIITMYKYNNAYIYDEVAYKTGLLNKDIYDILKKESLLNELIYADSSEPKSIAEINNLNNSNKMLPVKKGRDSIVNGIALINQQEIYVTSNSTNLKHELQNYIWMKDKEGNKINKPVDKFNHAIDAMRYVTMMQLDNPHRGSYHIW